MGGAIPCSDQSAQRGVFCQSVSPLPGTEPCLLNSFQGRLGSVSTDLCSSRGKDVLRCLRQRSWGRGIVGIVAESWQ